MKNSTNSIVPTIKNLHRRTLQITALCALTLLAPGLSNAADWEIDPVRIELSPNHSTEAVVLKNNSDQPTSIQIQAVAWTQLDGKDVYTPTRELLISPPIVTIPAKSEQILRVGLRRLADPDKELSYRINLQELPPPSISGFSGVQVALRIGLPVFVQPQKGQAVAKMAWNVSLTSGNQLKVSVQNQGNAHVQISDFALYAPGSNKLVSGESGSHYVLAGQIHEWLLHANDLDNTGAGSLRLKAYTDAANIDTELVLGKP